MNRRRKGRLVAVQDGQGSIVTGTSPCRGRGRARSPAPTPMLLSLDLADFKILDEGEITLPLGYIRSIKIEGETNFAAFSSRNGGEEPDPFG